MQLRNRTKTIDADMLAFLKNLPNLHQRGDAPAHSGGLNVELGRVFAEELGRLDSPSIIETGAGCTSLLFLMLGCSSVTSIAPDDALGQRIHEEAVSRGLDASALTFVNDRSERALPKMALGGKTQCQAALIDGNHGWPSVFVDFCYLNMMMDRDAILFVDDVHIYACEQLMLLLKSQPEYELLRLDKKMATFRK